MANYIVRALVVVSYWGMIDPSSGSVIQDERKTVIDAARSIALAVAQSADVTDARAVQRHEASIRANTERLRSLPNASSELEEVLRDAKSSYVTLCAAAYSLYLLEPQRVDVAVEALIRQMNRMVFADQMVAQRLILRIGAPAVPILTRHLSNSMVVHLLGAMGPDAREAVPALREAAAPANVEVASALVKILGVEANDAARTVLLEAISDSNAPHAIMAILSLAELGLDAKDAIPHLRSALSATDPDVRVYAAVALADVGDTPSAVEALSDLVRDPNLHHRSLALRKLASLGEQARAATPQLIEVLLDRSDKDYADRALAAAAVNQIAPNDPQVISALQRAASEEPLRLHLEQEGLLPKKR